MKVRIKLTKTEIILLLLTAVFVLVIFAIHNSGVSDEPWQITTEKESDRTYEIEPVNVNTATEEELISVEGIGPTLAQRIIAYREEHGPFRTIEELDNVKGIGPALLENIRYLVCTEDTQ